MKQGEAMMVERLKWELEMTNGNLAEAERIFDERFSICARATP